MTVKTNATITLSFIVDVKATYRYYKLQASNEPAPSAPTTAIPSEWTETEPTYTEGSTNTSYFVDKTVYTNDAFRYSAVSKSTSYEAAKDAYNKAVNAQNTADSANNKADNAFTIAQNAEKVATNFMSWEDGTGLVVGNLTKNTLGKNTLIDANGMAVRDNETELARFGSNKVELGKNNSDTTISMRNGNVVIEDLDRGGINYTRIGSYGNLDVSTLNDISTEIFKRGGILTTTEANDSAEWRYFTATKWSELSSTKWNELNTDKFASQLGTYFETRIYADHNDQTTANRFNTSRIYLRNAKDPNANRIESEMGFMADDINAIYENEYTVDKYDGDTYLNTPIKVWSGGDTVVGCFRSAGGFTNSRTWFGIYNSNDDALNNANRKAWFGHDGSTNFNIQNQAGGNNYVNKAWTVSSDERLKNDIEAIPDVFIDIWKEIEPKIFRWNELNYDIEQKYQFGIIAQDVISAFEKYGLDYRDYNLVNTFEIEGVEYFNVTYEHYNMLTSLVLKSAINKLDNLEYRIARLEQLIK